MKDSPVRLFPIFKERVWGGHRLEEFNYSLSSNKTGEAWLLCDHIEGKNLPALSEEFLGKNMISSKTGRLSLLIKLLDSNEDLSIQVHPSNDYKKLKDTELGKAEVWYVVDACPDAHIVYGLAEGVSLELLTSSIKNDTILSKVRKLSVKKGDVIYIPPGTVHALCAGVVVLEVQQNSDTTFRLFDYNRIGLDGKPRDLHIEQSLEVINFNDNSLDIKAPLQKRGSNWSLVERNEYFTVEICSKSKSISSMIYTEAIQDSCTFILCLDGDGYLCWSNGVKYKLKKGDCFLVPAGKHFYYFTGDNNFQILRSYIE